MNIFFNAFKKMFTNQIESLISKAKRQGAEEEREYRSKQRQDCTFSELEMMIGKPVIYIPNEWCNPIIGFGKCIDFITKAKTPVLIVEDYITGEDKLILSVPFYFSEQRFNAFAKLDPFELCSIVFKNSAWMEPFEKEKSGTFDGYDVLLEKLKKTDFFERIEKIKQK